MQAADIDETPLAGESARACAERLACQKALTICSSRPLDLVLGADTVVVVNDTMLGKPADANDAARMLRMLSGRVHQVITGICLASTASGRLAYTNEGASEVLGTENLEIRVASEITLVTFAELSDTEIRDYVSTGEPMDKAGSYAIQGIASRWIPRIEGDYSNVVGLPVALVYRMLRDREKT